MNLEPYCFPVDERRIAVDDAQSPLIDFENKQTCGEWCP